MGQIQANSLRSPTDYKNFIFFKFWEAYQKYHPLDMLDIAVALLDLLDEKNEEEREFRKKYLPELRIYYIDFSKGIETWYKIMGFQNKKCPFNIGCVDMAAISRYSNKSKIKFNDTDIYSRIEIEKYFKEMKAHLALVISKISKFMSFDFSAGMNIPSSDLPPEL